MDMRNMCLYSPKTCNQCIHNIEYGGEFSVNDSEIANHSQESKTRRNTKLCVVFSRFHEEIRHVL